MPWHDPYTLLDFAAGEIPTAAKLDRIKDNLNALKDATRAVWLLRSTPITAPVSTWGSLVWQTEFVDEWNGHADFTNVSLFAGYYTASANVVFSGATGGGEVAIRILRYNGAGVLVDTAGVATAPMNGGVSLTVFNNAAAGDFFVVQALSQATGTGHSWTGRFFVKQETAT